MKKLSKKQKKLLKSRKNNGQGNLSRVSQQEIDLLYATASRFFKSGKKIEAENYLNKVVGLNPSHHEALNLLGLVAAEKGSYKEATRLFEKALAINNTIPSYFNNLGNCQKVEGRFCEAITSYQKGIDLGPDNPERHFINQAYAMLEIGRTKEAITRLQSAIALCPDLAEAYKGLGWAHKIDGDFSKARAAYRQAIYINPNYAAAYAEMSECKKYSSLNDSDFNDVNSLLKNDSLSESDQLFLFFCLGKMYDDCKEYGKAFWHYSKGNALKRQEFDFDITQTKKDYDKLIAFFSKEYFQDNKFVGSLTERPVFIVGLPRSGTSLVEQIIASHSLVFGAGEQQWFLSLVDKFKGKKQGYPDCISTIKDRFIQKYSSQYEEHLGNLPSWQAKRITDKMPWNYENLGLIALLFPRAKIIHCMRNPIDTCLSNYFQIFKQGNIYSYDLKELGCWYKQYERLMNHWREVLPHQMLDVQYEEVIAAPEVHSKKIIEFLGLAWEESCTNFHKSKREVKTASAWQVRQPIYKSSSQRWKNYEEYLGSLRESLNI